jgi:uncharacterized protein YegJ (DUF2314 family)
MSELASADLFGVVLFADPPPAPADRFAHLPGFARAEPTHGGPWAATFSLDGLTATLEPPPSFEPMPAPLVDHDPRLSDTDRAVVRAGRSAVGVHMKAHADPFRGRKQLVRILGAVLGEHGAAAIDAPAQRIWTREALDDELSHDAPLDIEQMFTLHAVTRDGAVYWLHSHGLDAMGAVDFDVLRPHPSQARDAAGLVRAMALASIEGRLAASRPPLRPSSLQLEVRAIDAAEFMRTASPEDAALRDPRDHTDARVVLCDPNAKLVPGWMGKPRPARIFQLAMPDDALVFYSTNASRMAAERARGTYARMRAAFRDLEGLGLPALVKLGYETDGGDKDDREHIWFEVHACHEDAIDATCMNKPFHVASLKQGQRGKHSIDRLSDWQIMTPIGSITPNALHVVRAIAKDRAKIERVMAEHRARREK